MSGGARSDLPTEGYDSPGRAGAAPDRIGPYKILKLLGEGGMGVVYLAEQSEPIKRRVALKLIKLGMDTKEVIARFESERQALAVINHPNVARVLDAGATDQGRPYFVMEHVAGIRITEYCDTHRLRTRDRLKLFSQVCQAVQHAHQKGIIHRDLKPSNVLVSVQDGDPIPKVIDFGVAKATQQRLTEKTLFTEQGQLVGTPEYMSPEQAEMTLMDIDTRSDIYSLGVLLYELLTGTLPFEPTVLRRAAFGEIQRIIREEEPPKPSTRLTSLGAESGTVASNRGTDTVSLERQIKGDLDWIIMKAMEKDRTRRYSSASELSDDIARHLNHEPVVASPPSTAYRLKKFVRRNRGGVFAGALVGLALVIGLIGTATFAVREAEQRRIAEQNEQLARDETVRAEEALLREANQRRLAEVNEQKATRVQNFLQKMLESVDPEHARGKDTALLQEILDRSARAADKELADQPEVLAAIRNTLGITYLGLGRYEEAAANLAIALEIRRRVLGNEHIEVAETLSNLGTVKTRTADHEQAVAYHKEAVAIKSKLLEEGDFELEVTLNNLATSLDDLGRLDEAEEIHRRILANRRIRLGDEDANVAITLNNLGFLLMKRGKYGEAEAMFRESLDIRTKLYGEDHPDVPLSLLNLGHLLGRMGRYEQADPLLARALEIRRRLLGSEHPDLGYALNNLATNYYRQGKYDAAEPLFVEALPILQKAFGEDDWRVDIVSTRLADVLHKQGKDEQAEAMYRELLSRQRVSGDSGKIVQTLMSLSEVLTQLERYAEAETLLLEAHEKVATSSKAPPEYMQRVRESLVTLYHAWHKADPDAAYDVNAAEYEALGSE